MLLYAITFNTCACWGRDSRNGRHRHLVLVKKCTDLADAFVSLRRQTDALTQLVPFDEHHRLFPVYEFIVCDRPGHNDNRNRTAPTIAAATAAAPTMASNKTDRPFGSLATNVKSKLFITEETRKTDNRLDLSNVLRTIRFVTVGVYDPSVGRFAEHLRRLSGCEAALVVLASDANVRNWCCTMNEYLLPVDCHCAECVAARTTTRIDDRGQMEYDPGCHVETAYGLEESCQQIKGRVDECISSFFNRNPSLLR